MVAREWNIAAEHLIYVGDYKFDLEASKNAKMTACLLANQRNQMFQSMADVVINQFAQLVDMFINDKK